MIKLPLYIIERVNGIWELYNTDTCETLYFNTRIELDTHLKQLNIKL